MVEIRVTYYPPVGSLEPPYFSSRMLTVTQLRAAHNPERMVGDQASYAYSTLRANCPELVEEVPDISEGEPK